MKEKQKIGFLISNNLLLTYPTTYRMNNKSQRLPVNLWVLKFWMLHKLQEEKKYHWLVLKTELGR